MAVADENLKSTGLQAGFSGCHELSDFLDKHPISVKCLVSAGNKRVIVQDDHGRLWQHLEGEGQLEQLQTLQNGFVIQCATENLLVALNGQNEVYTADLGAESKLSFSQQLVNLSVSSVSCGLEHVVLVSCTGQVYSFGNGSRGQLGHGELTVDKVTKPKSVDTLEGIKVTSVVCGGWHSTAVTADGDLYVWGWNESGQLGLPNGRQNAESNNVSSLRGTQSDCPDERSRRRQRTNSGGGEACPSKEIHDVPVKIIQDMEPVQVQTSPYGLDLPDDLKVKKTSCGTRHTCVLLDSGILMTCGWNNYGQLCHGDTESRDFLETVQYFVDRGEKVADVKAECWNTAVLTGPKM